MEGEGHIVTRGEADYSAPMRHFATYIRIVVDVPSCPNEWWFNNYADSLSTAMNERNTNIRATIEKSVWNGKQARFVVRLQQSHYAPWAIGFRSNGLLAGHAKVLLIRPADGDGVLQQWPDHLRPENLNSVNVAREPTQSQPTAGDERQVPQQATGTMRRGKQEAIALRQQGLSTAAIAKQLGVRYQTAYQWLKGVK